MHIAAAGGNALQVPRQSQDEAITKVVQRIPVRIAIEPRADDPPLRNGMSATVEIDTLPQEEP